MRVFSFQGLLDRRCDSAVIGGALVAAILSVPGPLTAQWPGEVEGLVRDASTGAAVVGANVIFDATHFATTDASGRFRITGLPPGDGMLTVDAPSYVGVRRRASVANGRTTRMDFALQASPIELAPIEASGRSVLGAVAVAHEIRRNDAAVVGARTLGDAVRAMPGVVVQDRGIGSTQTLSIRGSDADAVLVLVDGVPINDPISGEADLSSINAENIEVARLHVGAASSQFGPRAGAGVLEVTTGTSRSRWAATVGTGSLGTRDFRVEGAGAAGAWDAGAAVSRNALSGSFGFPLPPEVGGGESERANADYRLTSFNVHADRTGLTYLRIRGGLEDLDRGLPGPGFAPSVHARQTARTARGSAWVGRSVGSVTLRTLAYASRTHRRFSDSQPPAGTPYDEASRLAEGAVDVAARHPGVRWLQSPELGASLRTQRIDSDALQGGPRRISDLGAYGFATLDPGFRGARLHARLRIDGAGAIREWRASHGLTLSLTDGPVAFDLSHRSSFSPPTLADQFFRDGVGIRPNPSLRAERIPSEFEAAARVTTARVQGGASAFYGDVRDRIVWQPDFRFVWSPMNTDVRRRGYDAWLTLQPLQAPVRLRGRYGYARVTYDRDEGADTVQLVYRPRHTGSLALEVSNSLGQLDVTGTYTGERFPVPAPINALPSFWRFDVSASRGWNHQAWSTEVVVNVRRLLDSQDTLIFGFPDPGRTLTLQVRVRRNRSHS